MPQLIPFFFVNSIVGFFVKISISKLSMAKLNFWRGLYTYNSRYIIKKKMKQNKALLLYPTIYIVYFIHSYVEWIRSSVGRWTFMSSLLFLGRLILMFSLLFLLLLLFLLFLLIAIRLQDICIPIFEDNFLYYYGMEMGDLSDCLNMDGDSSQIEDQTYLNMDGNPPQNNGQPNNGPNNPWQPNNGPNNPWRPNNGPNNPWQFNNGPHNQDTWNRNRNRRVAYCGQITTYPPVYFNIYAAQNNEVGHIVLVHGHIYKVWRGDDCPSPLTLPFISLNNGVGLDTFTPDHFPPLQRYAATSYGFGDINHNIPYNVAGIGVPIQGNHINLSINAPFVREFNYAIGLFRENYPGP